MIADLLAQSAVLLLLLAGLAARKSLDDFTDGNIEKLERRERDAAEAAWWLQQMKGNRQ